MSFEVSDQIPWSDVTAAELNHRLRNLLMVVRVLVSRTLDTADNLLDAQHIIGERLDAVARSADLLMRTEWQPIDLMRLAKMALAQAPSFESRFTADGPHVIIAPDAVLPLVLALHELETNAIKYGALSNSAGQVKLDWSVMGGEEAPVLRIRWTESDGPPVDYTGRRGFGSRLASGFLEQKLSGLVVYRFEPTGVLWQLTVPLPALGATLIRSSSSMSDHTNQRGNRPQSDA